MQSPRTVRITCVRCGAVDLRHTKGRKTPFCRQCSRDRIHESQVAHGQVAFAIRKGALEKPTEFICADCGSAAQEYDHRDYSKPLCVDSVCKSCNHKRPPAFDSLYQPIKVA